MRDLLKSKPAEAFAFAAVFHGARSPVSSGTYDAFGGRICTRERGKSTKGLSEYDTQGRSHDYQQQRRDIRDTWKKEGQVIMQHTSWRLGIGSSQSGGGTCQAEKSATVVMRLGPSGSISSQVKSLSNRGVYVRVSIFARFRIYIITTYADPVGESSVRYLLPCRLKYLEDGQLSFTLLCFTLPYFALPRVSLGSRLSLSVITVSQDSTVAWFVSFPNLIPLFRSRHPAS